jgi:hypothetical protein
MAASTLEQRVQTLEDIEAIRQLKARYLFCCDRKDPQGARACFVDGAISIDYGPIGAFDNADAMIKLFAEIGCQDHMVEMHHGVNAQIEILGPSRATGTWSLHYFLIDTRSRSLTQLGGYYEDEYRKTSGFWKISGTRFVRTSVLSMDIGEGIARVLLAGRSLPDSQA